MARLRVTAGTRKGEVYELGESAVLGRVPEVDIQVHDNKASRKHTRVSKGVGGWSVEDLESRNGTQVNGRKITRIGLEPGDVIKIGKTELTFEDPDAPQSASDKSAETETLQRPVSSARRPAQSGASSGSLVVVRRFDPGVFQTRHDAGLWDDLGAASGGYKAMVFGGVGLAAAVVGGLSYVLTIIALG